MSFNILKQSRIRNCSECINDNLASIEYVFNEPSDFLGFDNTSGLECKLVDAGYWFGVSVSGSCYVSRTDDVSWDGNTYDVVYLELGISPPPGENYPTTGRIEFRRESDSGWDPDSHTEFSLNQDEYRHVYSVDMTSVRNWQGTIANLRIYPFTDGSSGTKVFLKSVKLESKSTYACATGKDIPLCSRYSEYEHPCPWIGSRGYIRSTPVSQNITIVQGVNDYLYVNINSYGYKKILLPPGTNFAISKISYLLEEALNSVGIGGYVNSECYMDGNDFIIKSGTTGTDSYVLVSKSGSLSKTLGFFSSSDVASYTLVYGTASASRYETASLKLHGSDYSVFYSDTDAEQTGEFFTIGRDVFSPAAGNPGVFNVGRSQKLEFDGQTFIDINNPVSSEGLLVKLYYSGDLYDDTQFCIYRRYLDGSLVLVDSVDITGSSEVEDSLIEKTISMRVQKGDFIGLYSAAIHKGTDDDIQNFSYYLVSGMPSIISTEPEISGRGEKGAPIYCRGSRRTDEAIIDIEFEYPTPVEAITTRASLETTEEQFNLCLAQSGGVNGGIFIDTYTGLDSQGVQAPDIQNEEYLIDGTKYESNGSIDYCYPGWLDLSVDQQSKYDYTDFWLAFEFVRDINVEFAVSRVVLYFVDTKNIKDFSLEIPTSYSLDGSSKVWDTKWTSYSSVYTDGFLADTDLYIYNNPSVVLASDYNFDYEILGYRKLDLRFSPVDTRALRYKVGFGDLANSDITDANYSIFPIAPSPKISEVEIYFSQDFSHSVSGNFYVESSFDGLTYLKHNDVDLLTSGLVRCTVGRPVKYLRLHVFASEPMNVFDISSNISESDIQMSGDVRGIVKLNPNFKTPSGSVSKITITNTEDTTKTFFVDIDDDLKSKEQCIFWNKLGEQTIINSEIGAGCALSSRSVFNLRAHDYAYMRPSYFLNKFFANGSTAYISYDLGSTCSSIGSLITDGCLDSYLSNEYSEYHVYGFIYVYVDLGSIYNVDSVVQKAPEGENTFYSAVEYSNISTNDPCSITDGEWASGVSSSARWIRLKSDAVQVGGPGIRKLSYIEVWPSITGNFGKPVWKSSGTALTDGSSGSADSGSEDFDVDDTEYYCVDLGWFHNITGVYVGPFGAGYDYDDLYDAEPGDAINLLESDLAGSLVAFSAANVSNVNKVNWSFLDERPTTLVRWVAVKTRGLVGYAEDEIVVHVDNNDNASKSAFFSSSWWSSDISTISEEYILRRNGINSIRLDYASDVGGQYDTAVFSSDCGIDSDLARRDYLSFWMYISDALQMSSSEGYFKLHVPGSSPSLRTLYVSNSSDDYYKWNLSEIFSAGLEDGWNFILLPFSDNYKNGDIYIVSDDPSLIGQTNTRNRINGFSFQCYVNESNDSFYICFNDLKIVRDGYVDVNFSDGIYLPSGEHVLMPLDGFDPYRGSVEFFIKPDWARSPLCNSCDDPREHTIFRIHGSGTDYSMALFMTGAGLKYYVYDGSTHLVLLDNSSTLINQDANTHLALVWDFSGNVNEKIMSIFVNGSLTATLTVNDVSSLPSFSESDLFMLYLGGLGWEGVVSPVSSSADAVVENFKVYNYPIYDFSYSIETQGLHFPKRGSDLIEISSDGSTFYSSDDRGSGLPINIGAIAPTGTFDLYIRAKDINLTRPGEHNRLSYIKVSKIDTA